MGIENTRCSGHCQQVGIGCKRIFSDRVWSVTARRPSVLNIMIIKAEVQNLLDKRYVDPLDSGNDAASQRYYSSLNDSICSKNDTCDNGIKDKSVLYNFARGRTYIFSLNYKF